MAKNCPIIAVIEDDASVRIALQQLLRAAAFEAVTFASAEEFLSSESRGSVDCLLIDIHLPGMTGVALLKALTAGGGVLPVVLMTARDDSATRELIRDAGPVPHLHKPFSGQDLFEAIDRAMTS
jgi:FixJ family two-component response regulator